MSIARKRASCASTTQCVWLVVAPRWIVLDVLRSFAKTWLLLPVDHGAAFQSASTSPSLSLVAVHQSALEAYTVRFSEPKEPASGHFWFLSSFVFRSPSDLFDLQHPETTNNAFKLFQPCPTRFHRSNSSYLGRTSSAKARRVQNSRATMSLIEST